MKKAFFVLLLMIAAMDIYAQKNENWFINEWEGKKLKADFHYMNFQKNISMDIEFYNLKQLPYLPNIDSIITLVKQDLQYLSDSLKEDGIVRKLDYLATPKIKKITITNHTEQPLSYIVQNKELKQFKNDKDTLIIKLGVFAGDSTAYSTIDNLTQRQKSPDYYPVYIKFYLNNLKDILELKNELVSILINDMKDMGSIIKVKAQTTETGVKSMQNPAFEKDIIYYWNIQKKPKRYLEPCLGFGFQNVATTWLPSFRYGIKYSSNDYYKDYDILSLTMDNYYNFSSIGTSTERKDIYSFLTFKYTQVEHEKEPGFLINPSLSLGYMVIKKGDLFQPHTFKFAMPSLKNGWLSIGPEIFFNDLFKNTTLSIKLSLNYE